LRDGKCGLRLLHILLVLIDLLFLERRGAIEVLLAFFDELRGLEVWVVDANFFGAGYGKSGGRS